MCQNRLRLSSQGKSFQRNQRGIENMNHVGICYIINEEIVCGGAER